MKVQWRGGGRRGVVEGGEGGREWWREGRGGREWWKGGEGGREWWRGEREEGSGGGWLMSCTQ